MNTDKMLDRKTVKQQKQAKGDPWRDFREWSIAIYQGSSPLSLQPVGNTPVLTAQHVTDREAAFVADPFMLQYQNQWHMYFEVLLKESRKGVIAKAVSDNGLDWQYQRIVVEEDFHLSYPLIFEHDAIFYMIPETLGAEAIRLYKAKFPDAPFEYVTDLIQGKWADSTIFYFNHRWWLFSCSTPFQNRTLELFYADNLLGPWQAHPQNPIVRDNKNIARPGGRICEVDNKLIRFAQDCELRYGNKVRAAEVIELTPQKYTEKIYPRPVLEADNSNESTQWNGAGMHHIDAHQLANKQWIACVDGDNYFIPEYLSASEN
jgi:hypothetical protein